MSVVTLWLCLFLSFSAIADKSVPCWVDAFPIQAIDADGVRKWIKDYQRANGEIQVFSQDKTYMYYRKKERPVTEVKVMTWNIQHAGPDIFLPRDEQHRLSKNPQWYQLLWRLKLDMLARTVAFRDPEIIFLNEVSHMGMNHLMEAVFKPLGYTHFYFDHGGRSTGSQIGNAFVTKAAHPILNIESHAIEINGVRPDTRNILRAQIRVGDKLVSFLGVHFKSRRPIVNPPRDLQNYPSHMIRQQQVIKLLDLIKQERIAKNAVVVLGDINSPLTTEGRIEPMLMAPNRAYQNMESEADGIWSVTPWYTTDKLDSVRKLGHGHNPFVSLKHPTYVFNDFISINNSRQEMPDGISRPRYIVNKYPYKFDYIIVYPESDSVIGASHPAIVATPWHINRYGDPKSSWHGTQKHQVDDFFGPSDHFPVELRLLVQKD